MRVNAGIPFPFEICQRRRHLKIIKFVNHIITISPHRRLRKRLLQRATINYCHPLTRCNFRRCTATLIGTKNYLKCDSRSQFEIRED